MGSNAWGLSEKALAELRAKRKPFPFGRNELLLVRKNLFKIRRLHRSRRFQGEASRRRRDKDSRLLIKLLNWLTLFKLQP
jgi:hypothetical protein